MAKKLFEGIYRELLSEIRAEKYPASSFLPSEATLAERYGCSRETVRKALALLASNGYVKPLCGKGVRVIWKPSEEGAFAPGGLESVTEFAKRIGKPMRTKAIAFEHVRCTAELAATTQFLEGEDLVHVSLVRFISEHPALLDDHYFLASQVPGLTVELSEHSIFRYLEESLHLRPSVSKRTITVERATQREKELLEQKGTVFLACTYSLTYNTDGILFEYVRGSYLPEYFCFHDIATRPAPTEP